MKNRTSPLFLALVLAGIAMAVYWYAEANRARTIYGMIGSEKEAFFSDPRVQNILKNDYKLIVDFETVGSRHIATSGGNKGRVAAYDFVFPAGTPAAEKIKREYKILGKYPVFYTPMTIASWQPVVEMLEKNGIVTKQAGIYSISDMQKLMTLMTSDTRWEDIPFNNALKIKRRMLVNSTNILSSNSAAMYLSLASYITNQNNIVSNQDDMNQVLPKVSKLFTDQGFLASSSAGPFKDYLAKGMGHSPMVMIYESQFLHEASQKNSGISDDMVMLYPKPTIFTQHMLIAISEEGKVLGEALTHDQRLQQLAIEHGYRSNDASLQIQFGDILKQQGLNNVPTQIHDVIEPPTYEILESMIEQIGMALKK